MRTQKKQYIVVKDRSLCRLSRRLHDIIDPAGESHDVLDPLDFALGALYALMHAKALDYKDRDFPHNEHKRKQVLLTRAKEMGGGKLRTDGKWAAGFYFNSALMRLDAGFERFEGALKRIKRAKGKGTVDSGANAPAHWPENMEKVRREVIRLKHIPSGTAGRREVTYKECVKAAGELVNFLQANKAKLAKGR